MILGKTRIFLSSTVLRRSDTCDSCYCLIASEPPKELFAYFCEFRQYFLHIVTNYISYVSVIYKVITSYLVS